MFGVRWTKPARTNQALIFTWNDFVKIDEMNTHVLAYRNLDGRILDNVHVELDCVVLDNIMMNLMRL